MEKEIVEVDMAMLTKMLKEAIMEYNLSTRDPEAFSYWKGYLDALSLVLDPTEGEKDE